MFIPIWGCSVITCQNKLKMSSTTYNALQLPMLHVTVSYRKMFKIRGLLLMILATNIPAYKTGFLTVVQVRIIYLTITTLLLR